MEAGEEEEIVQAMGALKSGDSHALYKEGRWQTGAKMDSGKTTPTPHPFLSPTAKFIMTTTNNR
jgi:hypothetical protein